MEGWDISGVCEGAVGELFLLGEARLTRSMGNGWMGYELESLSYLSTFDAVWKVEGY